MDQLKALWSNQAVRYTVYALGIVLAAWIVWSMVYPTAPTTNVIVNNTVPAKTCKNGAAPLASGACADGSTPS